MPPRLHVITAPASTLAVVLRRGPVGAVASLSWDRATGAVRLGQWLRARVHAHRCDLSPDGRPLVVFAARGGGHAWTAVSRAPWLRALLCLAQGSTWCGGGTYAAMQERRGWRRLGGERYDAVLARDLPEGGRIELGFALGARNRAILSNRYAVVGADGADGARQEEPLWEWADLWNGRLQFAARGALWERPAPGEAPRRLHDLSALAFEPVEARDEGVGA